MCDSVRQDLRYFVERSLPDWSRDNVSQITRRRGFERGGLAQLPWSDADFDPNEGRLTIEVPSAKELGKWNDNPDDEGQAYYHPLTPVEFTKPRKGLTYQISNEKRVYHPYKVSPQSGGALSPLYGKYTCEILWKDWDQFRDNYFERIEDRTGIFRGMSKVQMLKYMLQNMDVQLHCNCPAFYWQGMQYQLSTIDAAIYPVTIPSEVWLDRHFATGSSYYPICKHLKVVTNDINTVNPIPWLSARMKRLEKQFYPQYEQ